ncbi:uncharacterized protein LOC135211413 [Macrobrachium nipponense]|uniref:uncharacterized protein LOC135211413 n=1 Tax=Macrobrachium nipponense TaxID=159736 RepID=UPI0030C80B4D
MEKQNRGPITNVANATLRTAEATKVSKATVERISKEARESQELYGNPVFNLKKRKRSKPVTGLDDFDKCLLRRIILQFYERKEIPTINKVLSEMRERTGFKGGRESLRKIVKEIGFQYAKLDGRKFLMERYDVQCLRTRFLEKMQNVRENGRNVIYLDETWVNQNYTVGKCWKDNKCENASGIKVPSGKGGRLIILHAGSAEGFIPNAELTFTAKNDGDYHRQMNHEVFEEWFRCQLLPNIPPTSIIVMDNAPYHSRKVDRLPTMSSKKAVITEWLISKGAKPTEKMLKGQLLEMVKVYSVKIKNTYVVDKIAAENGHEIIRLPPYHCQYNPIEQLIWGQVKSFIAKRNDFKMANLSELTKEALDTVPPENWENAVRHAEQLQVEDAAKDILIDKYIDSFIVSLDSSDEESSDEESS